MSEICEYFNVKIYTNFGVKSERYRSNADHTHINTTPDDVPYPIEPTWYPFGRHTIAFPVGVRESAVEFTW